ncbi:MAG: T9SS type A sorting domain-containing protein [Hymenobacter sp.]|nr:MAG: T9SS type A sorting domain-containing protein [Hymenobacter sp.]
MYYLITLRINLRNASAHILLLLTILAGANLARATTQPKLARAAGQLAAHKVQPTAPPVLVVVRGNSQAHGALTTGGPSAIGSETDGAWVDQAAALLGTGYDWHNRSHSGATIDYLRLSDSTEVSPLFGTGNYSEEWIVLQETTNQIFQANPAPQVYSKMVAWAQYWKARGVKVAVVTCYPMQDPQYTAEVDAINELYRKNWSSFCDMLLDVASSPYLTPRGMDPQYGYSVDGLHLTTQGNQIPAHCAAQGFGNLPRTGIIPATFVLPGIAVPGAPKAVLRLHYGTTGADYVTDSNNIILQRLDQSGYIRNATVIAGQMGPALISDNGQQVAYYDTAKFSQSLTVPRALAADTDASFVVDLRLLTMGSNSVLSIGPDFSIWFQSTPYLQVFSSGNSFISPLNLTSTGLTRCIFTFNAATREMVLYAHKAEIYRATLPTLPWVGSAPVLDLKLGGYQNGLNPLGGEIGTLAVYSGLLNEDERASWFDNAPVVPLPVELVAFTAERAAGTITHLSWTTASEKNSAYFEVERSSDGQSFIRLASVPAAGSSATPHSYKFNDSYQPAAAATLYYRLRLVDVDTDDTSKYSPVRVVASTPEAEPMVVFPNPTRTTATLLYTTPGTAVWLLDALGRVVVTATADATGTATLVLPVDLPKGLYFLRAGSQTKPLTVQ